MECSSSNKENRYYKIIDNIHSELDMICNKVDMIKCDSPKCESSTNTPINTELESKLNGLFQRIKSLKEDIYI